MKIILPMAGNGSRFFEAGYDKLKPLIDIKGKPMFVRVLDNILYGTDIHIIIRKDHVDEYKLDQLIQYDLEQEYQKNCHCLAYTYLLELY